MGGWLYSRLVNEFSILFTPAVPVVPGLSFQLPFFNFPPGRDYFIHSSREGGAFPVASLRLDPTHFSLIQLGLRTHFTPEL